VKNGDEIRIDVDKRTIELMVTKTELARRKKTWKARPPKIKTGYLARYAQQVTSAATGAVVKPEEVK
jgi:dihydroxy-acid dehydratase